MKRFSAEAREKQLKYLKRLDRWHRTVANIRRARARSAYLRGRKGILKPRREPTPRIVAPVVFSIETEDARTPLLYFLAQLRMLFLAPDLRAIVIDFSHTRRFVASGTLLFYAELTRLLKFAENRVRVRCTGAQTPRANQVLQQIGIFGLCGHGAHGIPTYDDVVHWRVAQGHLVDNTICAPAIEAYEGQLADPLLDGIFRGLGEAMTNAKHHAYTGIRDDQLEFAQPQDDWWMFSQARKGMLSVVFCDLGVGIPVTLPSKKPSIFARLLALGRANSDGACIKEAIDDSMTSTNLPGRGHGLGNIINVVAKSPSGVVMVMSNRGCYIMNKGTKMAFDFKESILGTLIFWRIPLDGGADGAA